MDEEKSLNELLDMDLEAVEQDGKAAGKRNLKILLVVILIAVILFCLGLSLYKAEKYRQGLENLEYLADSSAGEWAGERFYTDEGDLRYKGDIFVETVDLFRSLGSYKNSEEMLQNTLLYEMYGERKGTIYAQFEENLPVVKFVDNNKNNLWEQTARHYDAINRRFVYSVTCDDDSKYLDGDSAVMPMCLAVEQLGNMFTQSEWDYSIGYNIASSNKYKHRWWEWIAFNKDDLINLYDNYDGEKNRNYLESIEYDTLLTCYPNFEFVLKNSNDDVLFRSINGETDYRAWSMEGVDEEKIYEEIYSTVVSLVDNGNYQQVYDYIAENWIAYDELLDYKDLYDYYWYAYALVEHTQDNLMTWTDIDQICKISAGFKDADNKLAGIRNAKNSIVGEWRYRNEVYGKTYTLDIYNDGSSGLEYGFFPIHIGLSNGLGWVTKDGVIKYAFSKADESTKYSYGSNDTIIVPNGKTLNLKYKGEQDNYACGTYIRVEK